MREKDKYAIGLLYDKGMSLCHSTWGEETITPNWVTIPRMLDKGNVLRYVNVYYDNNIMKVKFWEKTQTLSFVEWLGLSSKQSARFGGEYSISTDIDGIHARLEFSEDDMKRMIANHPEFIGGNIQLKGKVRRLQVNDIIVGHKMYDTVSDFMQMYEAENFGIPRLKNKYGDIKKDAAPLWFRYFDKKNSVVRLEGDNEVIVVKKDLPDLDVLFGDSDIKFDQAFMDDFITRTINDEAIQVHHIGMPFQTPPVVIKTMKIFNKMHSSELTNMILDFYNQTDLQDSVLSLCIKLAIFELLRKLNEDSPISHFFKALVDGIVDSITVKGILTETEGQIIEYKSRDVWVGNPKKIAEYLANDIETKLKQSHCKVYFIGIEDNGNFSPVAGSRLGNDILGSVKEILISKLSANVYIFPIIKEKEGIILLIVHRN
jgi:hypothetical protein